MLGSHLKALGNSVFNDYEVIVVDDGSEIVPNGAVRNQFHSGPGGARNCGAAIAKGDILMFVGDDTLPSEDLLLRHWYTHKMNPEADVVQGYTMFHPSVMGTYFMDFLEKSGFQANWQSLKNKDGGWKSDATGFFLTTNVSIKRDSWDKIGGFSARFNKPAWEDAEMGIRLQRNSFKTIFDPTATNFHVHGYTYPEFCQRQKMEGGERLNICLEHPEMGPGLIQPQVIRSVEANADEAEIMNNGADMPNLNIPKLREIQYSIWAEGLQIMSVIGLIESINKRGGAYNVFKHLHKEDEVVMCLSGIRALGKGDFGYAQHTKTWLLDKVKDDWAVFMYAVEVDLACKDREAARYFLGKAKAIAPNENWVVKWTNSLSS
jgi:hypothetical protein